MESQQASLTAAPSSRPGMAALIAAFDWSTTPLGPRERWAPEVRAAVDLILRSPLPMATLWGPAAIMIFNDGYAAVAGPRAANMLGRPANEAWPEAAAFNDHVMRTVFAGQSLSLADQELTLAREARPQAARFNLDYSPIVDTEGRPVGVFAVVVETTERRAAARRLELLQDLNDQLQNVTDPDDAIAVAVGFLGEILRTDRVGYGTVTHDPMTFSVPRDWTAPGIRSIVGVIAFHDYLRVLDELKRGETIAVADARTDPRTRDIVPTLEAAGSLAIINIPVIENGEVVALLFVNAAKPRQWTDDEVALAEEVALRLRTTVERRRAEARLRQREDEMREGELRFREMLETQIEERTAELERTEAQFRLLVQGVTDYAIYMLDAEGNVSSWNAGAQRIKGYSPDEVIGTHFSRFYTDEDRATGMPEVALRRAAEFGRFEREGWRVRKDGTTFWAHVVIDALHAPDGRLLGFAKITRDITERREAQLALEQSEKNIRAIFETSHLHQGLLAVDGTLLYANGISLAAIGKRREDVLGLPYWQTPWFTGTPGIPEQIHRASESAARGEPVAFPMTLTLPGGVAHFDFTMRPVKSDDGEVVGMVPEAIDTTARLLTEAALQQSQKMEAIGNLTGGIAHDFNNLLSAVMGSLELLRKRLPDDPARLKLLDNAMEGARRGASLTRRMLAFARRQDLKAERIDAGALIDGMEELLRRSLGPTIAIETSFPRGLPQIEADANQLESAILNLAVNSRDAMRGEGRLLISGHEEIVGDDDTTLKPGRYLVLSVADNGEGMDEATLKHATEPFFTTKGVGKGTGLGLSMVHGLAQQLGGTLMLKSAPLEGTTAEIWLPAASGEIAQPRAAEAAPPAPAEEPPRRLKVLAVDDDALVLMNTSAMLVDMGHEVTEAYSAREALRAFEANGFDLVITDHAMPQMTGAQLALELRARHPDVPILLATGYADLPSGEDPGLPRLAKPFGEADLARAVENALRNRPPMG